MKYELTIRVGNRLREGTDVEYPADVLDAVRKALAKYISGMGDEHLPEHVQTYHLDGRRIVVHGIREPPRHSRFRH